MKSSRSVHVERLFCTTTTISSVLIPFRVSVPTPFHVSVPAPFCVSIPFLIAHRANECIPIKATIASCEESSGREPEVSVLNSPRVKREVQSSGREPEVSV